MKRTILTLIAIAAATANSMAQDTSLVVRTAGPFALTKPLVIDSTSVTQTKFSEDNLINTPLSLNAADKATPIQLSSWQTKKGTLNLATFDANSTSYMKAKINVKGAKSKKVFVDGKEAGGEVALQPGIHKLAVKFIADSTGIDINVVPTDSTKAAFLCLSSAEKGGKTAFSMRTNLETRVTRSANVSPSGRWALVSYQWYDEQNKSQWATRLVDLTTGRESIVSRASGWMPRSDRYYYTENVGGKDNLVTVDPATGRQTVIARDLPSSSFTIAPTEDYLILYKYEEGPKKETGVYEIVHPDDRQPNWRSRSTILRYDLATGFTQPLTYGYKSVYVSDITDDGKYLLLSYSTDSLTQRPTTRSTFLRMNVETLEAETLIEKDGFVASGQFMKGHDDIIFMASPEAFGGIANIVPAGMTASNFDYHLYHFDCKTKKATPLTANDNTTVDNFVINKLDNSILYSAQRADSVLLYRYDMKTNKSRQIGQPLEVINGFSFADKGGNILVHGSSATVPYRVYNIPARNVASPTMKTTGISLVLDPNAELFANVSLGECKPWKFTCKRGYEVSGHYYLPANFDPSKKYPVIVHYYGGCSPTSRRFGGGSHYPAHYWNALGYITFIVNPSGATGFGQEWAARHVNTMGEGVVQDIIEATQQFAEDVPQVDKEHIGCVSASYGGFMTQNILIHTDFFACGISHAGISDHTSYWGEGYWGYSYSETSAANSYPWTRKDLYVDRSPLYNADKIHKPLLFTHGTADTNVPIGESIQMYTALKLLGRPTAFIQVEGENHGIMDPVKRTLWIDSMVAWFQKWLKDDSSWWDSIYKEKKL